jgi:xanthine dehydrogenase small subunit
MRDHVLFYVNGRRFEIGGETAFLSLTDFLRLELRLTGAKVVCAEGDCGACSVLVGRPDGRALRYVPVDACIQFLYQLDCRHVVTVEGLGSKNGADTHSLHPVQRAMVEHHGSQCGYCTPGFVMALTGMFEQKTADVPTALTGNLCRCTGYVQILEAAAAVDRAALPPVEALYPSAPMLDDFRKHQDLPVSIDVRGPRPLAFFGPRNLADAVAFKARRPQAAVIAGGTELGVLRNKQGMEPRALLSLAAVPGLAEIRDEGEAVVIGANVTWTQMEAFARKAWPEFHRLVERFGSPQIRNVATVVANVAHGSPIADSLPFLFVADAELDLIGPAAPRRVKVNDFYRCYKMKDLAAEEIITHLRVPRFAPDDLWKLYKVSRRNDLDIATFGAAVRVRKAGDAIGRASVAYSGVAPTVVRLPRAEAFLQGKRFSEETFAAAGRIARSEIQPISDVRGSRDFRARLAETILQKFYFDCLETEAALA